MLVVVSKVKKIVRAVDDMHTSAATLDVLSKHVEDVTRKAIDHAKADGRKTVMDRDVELVLKGLVAHVG